MLRIQMWRDLTKIPNQAFQQQALQLNTKVAPQRSKLEQSEGGITNRLHKQ